MNITVVHGVIHKGSTYNIVKMITEGIGAKEKTCVTEFFLPRDMPEFCIGCYSCFYKGEDTCPHFKKMAPIAAALDAADIIILDSPSYVCDVSGGMKTLLDHFGYRWMPHRPSPSLFGKIGVAVSTAAGAGTVHANSTMKKSLKYWGVKRFYSLGLALRSNGWDDTSPKMKKKAQRKTGALCKKLIHAAKNINGCQPRFSTQFLFFICQKMQASNSWNEKDKSHWKTQGWLDGKKPWEIH